jgi:hypothetical protein
VVFGALERMIKRFSGDEEARGLGWLVERTKKPYAQCWLCREQSCKLGTFEELKITAWNTYCWDLEERLEVALRWH